MPSRYAFSSYTVALICALPLELRALTLALDSLHPDLPHQPRNDENAYIYGAIGNHNVVITCLPKGVTGPSPATYTVTNLGNTFPNLRFCLFVGIGGGIPSEGKEGDIRLGDVVVSIPDGTQSGVVQYNHGKIRTGPGVQEMSVLERTGSLSKPPKVLLNVVGRVEARMFNDDGVLLGVMERMRERLKLTTKSKRKLEALSYPGSVGREDLLFCAEYAHRHDLPDCAGCDRSQVVERSWEERQSEDFEPRVHAGTIASGDYVVKDAATREELRRAYGAKCVETEAAGIMDSFPCLVIRGISDYADSHKNDDWQQYAALSAAAYATIVLETIQPEAVKDMPSTRGMLFDSDEGMCSYSSDEFCANVIRFSDG
jgi:nucleoside phosphorylase